MFFKSNLSKKNKISIFVYTILILSVVLLPVQSFSAGIPSTLSYQGKLTDTGGNALGGSGTTYYFKFSIWDNATPGNGTKLWPSSNPTAVDLTVKQGSFAVNIGDIDNGYPDALDYDFNTSNPVYLQIEVSSDNNTFETLAPRSPISSNAFSHIAGAVNGTNDSSFGTNTPFADTLVSMLSTAVDKAVLTIKGMASQTASLFNILDSNDNTLFTVTASGNVGVGTTTPQGKLNIVNGSSGATANVNANNLVIESSGNNGISLLAPNTSYSTIRFAKPSNGFGAGIQYFGVDDSLQFITNGTEKFRVTSTGNIGIGTTNPTSSFSRNIQVTGAGSAAMTLDNGSKKYSFGVTGTGSLGFYDETLSAYRLSIDSSGNIGVGTSTPGAKLDVNGSTLMRGVTEINNGGTIYLDPTVALTINDISKQYLFNMYDSGSIRMSLTRAGRLSIGSLNGGSLLNVKGSAAIGDTYYNIAAPTNGLIVEGNVGVGTSTPGSKLSLGSGQLEVPTGSASLPSYSFSGDLNTGIYRVSEDLIGFTTSGIAKWFINSSGTLYSNGTYAVNTNGGYYAGSGSATIPTYSFGSDTNTGMYLSSADSIGFTANGTLIGRFNSSGLTVDSGVMRIQNGGSAAAPSYTFVNDPNTGMFNPSADNLQLSTGGTTYLQITSAGNVFVDSAVQFRIPSGSVASPGLSFGAAAADAGIYRLSGSTLGISTAGTSRMLFESNGQIGINKTSSLLGMVDIVTGSALLDTIPSIVAGKAVTSGDSLGASFRNLTGTTGAAVLEIAGITSGSARPTHLRTNSSGWLGIHTGSTVYSTLGTERITVTFSGNVGINDTNPTSYTFNVKGLSGVNPFSVASSTGTVLFNVLGDGNVGIGTASPTLGKLQVSGNVGGNTMYLDSTSGLNILAVKANTNGQAATVYTVGSSQWSVGPDFTDGSGVFKFHTSAYPSGAAGILNITRNGLVGIGTTTPSVKLSVVGNAQITAVTSGTYAFDLNLTSDGTLTTASSDERLKTNITLLNASTTLDKLLLLKPSQFEWKSNNTHDIGLIAQEVEDIFPELVFENPTDGYKGINYSRLPVLLLVAVQEIASKVEVMFAWFGNDSFNVQGEVCVDDVCVSKEQFKQILEEAGGVNSQVPQESTGDTSNPVEPEEGTDSASSNTQEDTSGDTVSVEENQEENTSSSPVVEPEESNPSADSVNSEDNNTSSTSEVDSSGSSSDSSDASPAI